VTGCRNIHALFPDLLHRSFYIPKTNRTLISSITFAAVGSCCVESYAVCSTVSSTSAGSSHGKQHVLKHFFGLSTYLCYTFFFFLRIRHTRTEYVVMFRQNYPVSNFDNQFASYDYFVRTYGVAGGRTSCRSEFYRLSAWK